MDLFNIDIVKLMRKERVLNFRKTYHKMNKQQKKGRSKVDEVKIKISELNQSKAISPLSSKLISNHLMFGRGTSSPVPKEHIVIKPIRIRLDNLPSETKYICFLNFKDSDQLIFVLFLSYITFKTLLLYIFHFLIFTYDPQ